MRKSTLTWKFKEEEVIDEEFSKLLEHEGLSKISGRILWKREIRTAKQLEQFLHPQASHLHDPLAFYDMEKAIQRIKKAIEKDEKILIYGDYDADGITSTTILKEALESIGANILYYLPNRFTDGYGPNKKVYQYFIERQNVQLIITVDNGVSGLEAIDYAQKLEVDVIVTDHHELPQNLPNAYAIIHPKHPKGDYPFGKLAGVGVAFKLAWALLGEFPTEFLDLVAIGTLADLVSLTDENRVFVSLGLKTIRNTERIGLIELMKVAGIKRKGFTEAQVGFGIAPRLNALGRLKDPNLAVELLSTFDPEEAKRLAQKIQSVNEERKQLVEQTVEEALELLFEQPDSPIQILIKSGWNPGILGIVASKILNMTGKSTIIFTLDEKGNAKGSARSVEALNIFKALDEHRELFLAFGGHHMAAGMTLPVENLEMLRKILEKFIKRESIDVTQGKIIKVETILNSTDITIELTEELARLAPFGAGNPKPVFALENPKIQKVNNLGNKNQHLKMKLTKDFGELEIISWENGGFAKEFTSGGKLSLIGELGINEWNGRKKIQYFLTDFAIDGIQFFDLRGKQGIQFLPKEKSLFLACKKENLKILSDIESIEGDVLLISEKEKITTWKQENKSGNLVLVDVPENSEELREILQNLSFHRIFFLGMSKEEAYIIGMGKREQFSALFQFIRQQESLNIRKEFQKVAQYLKIPVKLLIFMIKVFEELGFLTITDGVLEVIKKPQNHKLTESVLYQKRKRQIKQEMFFLLSNQETLQKWFERETMD
ncbi:MAG: single-stranded-DNA-specific exonuclease RecJ [Lactobacillales bacterium]|nr:single-stranded-DNA-specific exonuclease RecJ [Lactobacillales bacterium]